MLVSGRVRHGQDQRPKAKGKIPDENCFVFVLRAPAQWILILMIKDR
jgi:hypothetical protein